MKLMIFFSLLVGLVSAAMINGTMDDLTAAIDSPDPIDEDQDILDALNDGGGELPVTENPIVVRNQKNDPNVCITAQRVKGVCVKSGKCNNGNVAIKKQNTPFTPYRSMSMKTCLIGHDCCVEAVKEASTATSDGEEVQVNVDVDECTESRAGSLCEQRCYNVRGGYRCSCHRGYRLNADNKTCSDFNECEEFKSKVLCVGRCLNELGSYRCSCPSGYRLSEDKRSCIDINECETGVASCAGAGASNVCLNTRGGYRCHRIVCPQGYQFESKNRCSKVERVCPVGDMECAHQPSTYFYAFFTVVSNLYITASKLDLFTMRGPTWPHAHLLFQLRLVDVNSPLSVKKKADINSFVLTQSGHKGTVSLVRSLEGPQSIELELVLEQYNRDRLGGIAVAKIFIFVSEYEF